MSDKLFTIPEVQKTLGIFMDKFRTLPEPDPFSSKRNDYIRLMISSFLSKPENWDNETPISNSSIGGNLIEEVQSLDFDKPTLDIIFSYCYRFLVEFYLTVPNELDNLYSQIYHFALHEVTSFDRNSQIQIEYALRGLPVCVVKRMVTSQDFEQLKSFASATAAAQKLKSEWDANLNEREVKLQTLSDELKKHETAFNFVELYEGFSDLGRTKLAEKSSAKLITLLLGLVIPLPLFVEFFYLLSETAVNGGVNKLTFIPMASLTLLFVYYFRISLANYNSIKAQLIQIELRKSLCRFIQRYADYSKEIKSNNPDALEKFESLIFSNIMPSEDKIPSTFDGVEQIASLLNAIKK